MYTGPLCSRLSRVLLFAFVLHSASAAHAQTIKAITLESGALTGAAGADRLSGSVSLETGATLKGAYSARIANAASAYLEERFSGTDAFYVSAYVRLHALPAKDVRLLLISNSGTTVGNLVLRSTGRLRLRQASTAIGSESAPLQVGQLYRIGVQQRRGTGRNAVLAAYLASGDQAFGSAFATITTGTWTTAASRLRIGATTSAPANVALDDVLLAAGSMPAASTSGTSSPTPTQPTEPTEPNPTEPTPTEPPTSTSGTVQVTLPVQQGLWIGKSEILARPMSGSAWTALLDAANNTCATADLSNQDSSANVCVLAKALVFARTGNTTYRAGVLTALRTIAGSGTYSGRALALGRELAAYVIAADLIDLKIADPTLDTSFRRKIRELLTTPTSDGPRNLVECHEKRPNNWGTHCGASRAAVASYLGDTTELARTARIFKGWLGDRAAYASFSFGELWWQCDPTKPVGIVPASCPMENLNGVLPDDQRRAGGYTWPPQKENYTWGALQGALVQAVLLRRAGYDVFSWEDKALYRAVRWLYVLAQYPADGDSSWLPHIANHYYGTSFAAPVPSRPGKNAGYTDWSHGR